VLPTGQVVGVLDELPSGADVVDGIVSGASATLARLAGEPAVETRSEGTAP